MTFSPLAYIDRSLCKISSRLGHSQDNVGMEITAQTVLVIFICCMCACKYTPDLKQSDKALMLYKLNLRLSTTSLKASACEGESLFHHPSKRLFDVRIKAENHTEIS